MPAAIKIGGGGSVTLRDIHVRNTNIGVRTDGTVSLRAENVSFEDVGQAWDVAGPAPSEISGTRITRPTSLTGGRDRSSVGWRRPKGPPIPAFCPQCKSVFPSRNYNIGSSSFYARDNDETCLSCGFERAKLCDGLFDLTGEVIRILKGPDFTHAMLASVAAISDRLFVGNLAPALAAAKYETVSPALASCFRKATSFGNAAVQFLGAAASIAAVLLTLRSDASSDAVATKVLAELAAIRFTLEEAASKPLHNGTQGPSARPPATEAAPEKRTVELSPQRQQQTRASGPASSYARIWVTA